MGPAIISSLAKIVLTLVKSLENPGQEEDFLPWSGQLQQPSQDLLYIHTHMY